MTVEGGTYALLLHAAESQHVDVGALGRLRVRPGVYVYVGSAFGPGGLCARVQRHVRADGPLHWHVDYLRAVTSVEAVWFTCDSARRECLWAAVLQDGSSSRIPRSGFGASDCDCSAHLVAFDSRPSLASFRRDLRDTCPAHESVVRTAPEAWIE